MSCEKGYGNGLAILVLWSMAMSACGGAATVSDVAHPALRPAGAPRYSDVSMRLFRKHKDQAEIAAGKAFHITRADWSYIRDPEYIRSVHALGWSFQGSLNAVTTNAAFARKDANGQPMLDHFGKPGRYWADSDHPAYRQWYLDELVAWLEAGADSLQRDEPTTVGHVPGPAAAAFFRELHAQFEKKTGRRVPQSCNMGRSLFDGDRKDVGAVFDYGMSELGAAQINAAFLWEASRDARRAGKFSVFTSHADLGAALYRKAIAGSYAMGALFMVPWDQFAGTKGQPRVFSRPEDLADLYGFVRANADVLDGYEDAAAAGGGLADPRWATNPVLRIEGPDHITAFVRAKSGDPAAPAVIHLVDWDGPKPFRIRLRSAAFFPGGALALELRTPAPYDGAAHAEAERAKDYAALSRGEPLACVQEGEWVVAELPALRPWGMLVVSRREAGYADLPRWVLDARARHARTGPPALVSARVSTEAPQAGRCVRIEVDLTATYTNPYDPAQVRLDAEIVAADGSTLVQPGFFRHAQALKDGVWHEAEAGWEVRFTPRCAGRHDVRLRLATPAGEARRELAVQVAPGVWPGVVRVSREDRAYLALEDGKAYFPIGINLIPNTARLLPASTLADAAQELEELAAGGGNFVRLRADCYFVAIEREPLAPAQGYLGAGWYNQLASADLDGIVAACERLGIRILWCFENAQTTVNAPYTSGNPDVSRRWHSHNPFAHEAGGPAADAKEFWRSQAARDQYRARCRYTLARWGASPAVLGWELWNELRYGQPDEEIERWHAGMAAWINANDPLKRFVTVSVQGARATADALSLLDGFELVCGDHAYVKGDDMAGMLLAHDQGIFSAVRGRRPVLMGEFGIAVPYLLNRLGIQNWQAFAYDPGGIHLHNGLWAGTLSGYCGAPAFWFSRQLIRRHGLYSEFLRLKQFTDEVPFGVQPLRPVEIKVAVRDGESAPPRVVALGGPTCCYAWIQNPAHTWERAWRAQGLTPAAPARMDLGHLAPGVYTMRWYDTYAGKWGTDETLRVVAGAVVSVDVPAVERDRALAVRRRSE